MPEAEEPEAEATATEGAHAWSSGAPLADSTDSVPAEGDLTAVEAPPFEAPEMAAPPAESVMPVAEEPVTEEPVTEATVTEATVTEATATEGAQPAKQQGAVVPEPPSALEQDQVPIFADSTGSRAPGQASARGPMLSDGAVSQDWLVAIEVDGTPLVVWQLSPSSWQRLDSAEHAVVVRVVGTKPTWEGAERLEQEVQLKAASGTERISRLQGVPFVRAALGVVSERRFLPVLVGITARSNEVTYRPHGVSVDVAGSAARRARASARP
jgi:hypothetical protein